MAHYNHRFGEAFVGGDEHITPVTHMLREEAREDSTPMDLTGYSISAEVWWEGGHQLSPAVAIGNLATGEPHYTVTLNEGQTMQVPLGRVAFVKLIRQSPDGVTTIRAPIWLQRTA